jgi:hypothetical protein
MPNARSARALALAATLLAALVVVTAPACGAKGTYARRDLVDDDGRGDTNGKSFDFISTKPDGDEWTIRIRGSSMWVAYSTAEDADDLGSFKLTSDELDEVWELIDELDLTTRKRGLQDRNEGTVTMRLRDPQIGDHDIYLVYVSRATDDETVLDLGDLLADLVEKHRDERPTF